jgi:Nickel responsive protein SCO4226-like
LELVLVERRFEQPVEFGDIKSLAAAGSRCFEAHDVRFLKSFFSRDGRRMLCLYEAPDAEAVRIAENQAKVPYERAWSCTNLRTDRPLNKTSDWECVVAESRFSEKITPEFVALARQQSAWCLELHRAEYIESFLGTDGLRMVCIFRAPDAEAVRRASQQGGMPYAEIWTASVHPADESA